MQDGGGGAGETGSPRMLIFNNHTSKRPIDVAIEKGLVIVTSHRLEAASSEVLRETIGPCYYVYEPKAEYTKVQAMTLHFRPDNIARITNEQLARNARRDWPQHASYGAFASSMDARTLRHHKLVGWIDSIYRSK
jgi:hypothetical protein